MSVSVDSSRYEFPVNDSMPEDWTLKLAKGDNYKVIDDIIKPEAGFKGTLKVD